MPMSAKSVYQCQCPNCVQAEEHPDQRLHHQMNLLLSRMDEQQRRWYVALEANRLGHGGRKAMKQITGISADTIRRGQRELAADLETRPTNRVRLPGGGRRAVEKKRRGWRRR